MTHTGLHEKNFEADIEQYLLNNIYSLKVAIPKEVRLHTTRKKQ